MHQHSIIVICGPTAVGKTGTAIELAQLLQTEIISADSRQCFKELNIGVAKPSVFQLSEVKHYFINSHSINEEVNAGIFEQYALNAAQHIFTKSPVAIVVGGTGLYIKAFTEGMDEMPAVPAEVRQEVLDVYKHHGLAYLQKLVADKDPAFWKIAEQDNPQRLMRALEIVLASGKSVVAFRQGKQQNRPFNIIKIGLELPRMQLYKQVNNRVDEMVKEGLVEEAFQLMPQRTKNALQTVGYKEFFEYYDGMVSLPEAIENIKTNTRHYAKRQLTWFKKDPDVSWHNPKDASIMQSIVEKIPGYH